MTITVFSNAVDIAAAIAARTTTSHAVCQMYLDRIAAKNPLVNAIVQQRSSTAILADADAADARALAGTPWSPLDGVPFTLKMALMTQGLVSANTNNSTFIASPAVDGSVAARMRAAGMVIMGKTNGPGQFPFRTKTTQGGETRNPFKTNYATGGSSGGSACAVAAGLTPVDVGIDSAGSVRIPASFCGVVGFKPTNNSVPGHGDMSTGMPSNPPSDMLDLYAYGPICRSIDDCAAVFRIISGPNYMRPNCPRTALLATNPTLRKIRVVKTIGPWFCNWQSTIDAFLARQSVTVDTSLSSIPWFSATDLNNIYAGLATDALGVSQTLPKSANNWYAAQLNYAPLPTRYAQGKVHSLWLSEVQAASLFGDTLTTRGDVDILALPATALSPPLYGGTDPSSIPYLAFTALWSIMGNPCVVVQLGTDPNGIPFGIQFVARHWEDLDLLYMVKQLVGLPGFTAPVL